MKTNLLIACAIMISIVGCQKNPEENTTTDPASQIEKKWILPPSGNSTYSWIEFLPGNAYLLQLEDGTLISGNYSIGSDQKTVNLAGFGTLAITSLNNNEFAFTLKPTGGTISIPFTTLAGAQTASSTRTDLFCHKWNLYKSVEDFNGMLDTTYYPQTYQAGEGPIKIEVVVSKYGTYYVRQVDRTLNGYDTSYLGRSWIWVDQAQTTMKYFDDIDTGYAKIEELTTTKLRMTGDGEESFLNR